MCTSEIANIFLSGGGRGGSAFNIFLRGGGGGGGEGAFNIFLSGGGGAFSQVNYNANSFLSGGGRAFFPSELQC